MLLFSADPTIFFLAHGELKKPPSKVAYFSSCWTVSVCTSKNDSICPAKKVYGSFELFGGHVMEQLLASKCTKIRVGGGGAIVPLLPSKFCRPWMLVAFDSDSVMKMFVDDLQLCVRRSSKIKSETCRSIDYFLIIIQNTEIYRPWKIVVRAAFWLAHLLTNAQTTDYGHPMKA